MAGHVFVLRGKLQHLACDAWLLPTDRSLTVKRYWFDKSPTELGLCERLNEREEWERVAEPPAGWGRDVRSFAAPARAVRERHPACRAWLTDVGGHEQTPLEWYLDGVRDFAHCAAPRARESASAWERAKPLLALPGIGTGEAGQAGNKAPILRALMSTLEALARELDVDFALVALDPALFAMVQRSRASLTQEEFDSEQLAIAKDLAMCSRRGELVPFLGAGVSAPSGLPRWSELLAALAQACGAPTSLLEGKAPPQTASALEQHFRAQDTNMRREIAEQIRPPNRVSLAHAFLASLTGEGAITTNYDRLFERAFEDAESRPLSVLRHGPKEGARHWLLKLHGCVDATEDIVITAEDYDEFKSRRALQGIVQAMLVTKHVLFAGFSLTDPSFDAAAAATREAMAGNSNLGTALMLSANDSQRAKWGDIRILGFGDGADIKGAARRVEIFLDRVVALADTTAAHFLDETYAAARDDEEQRLAEALYELAAFDRTLASSAAWQEVRHTLERLGWRPAGDRGGSPR